MRLDGRSRNNRNRNDGRRPRSDLGIGMTRRHGDTAVATTATLAKTRTRTIFICWTRRGMIRRGRGGRRLGGGLVSRRLRDARLGGSRLMRARRRAVASSCRVAESKGITTGRRNGVTETRHRIGAAPRRTFLTLFFFFFFFFFRPIAGIAAAIIFCTSRGRRSGCSSRLGGSGNRSQSHVFGFAFGERRRERDRVLAGNVS